MAGTSWLFTLMSGELEFRTSPTRQIYLEDSESKASAHFTLLASYIHVEEPITLSSCIKLITSRQKDIRFSPKILTSAEEHRL